MLNVLRVTLVMVAVLLPCSTATAQFDGDTRELFAYRLTTRTLRQVDAATVAMAAELKKDPRYRQRLELGAEIAKLEKKEELSDAEQARLELLREKIEALGDADDVLSDGDQSLSDMEASIRKTPVMARALQSAGLTPREYSKFMLCLFQATVTAGMKKSGLMKEIPAEVPPENVKFAEEHEAELKALQEKWKAMSEGVP